MDVKYENSVYGLRDAMGSVVVIAAEAAAYVLPAKAAKRCCRTD